jgi:hypothetical protein
MSSGSFRRHGRLLNPNHVLRLSSKPFVNHQHQEEGIIMKKAIVTLACALIVPLAFGQTSSKVKKQRATTTAETVTVTGTMVTASTTEEGTAASYQPAKTLVIREDGANKPGHYVLNGPGRIVNKKGKIVRTAIQPGARVRVYYVNTDGSRVVDHVVVE